MWRRGCKKINKEGKSLETEKSGWKKVSEYDTEKNKQKNRVAHKRML